MVNHSPAICKLANEIPVLHAHDLGLVSEMEPGIQSDYYQIEVIGEPGRPLSAQTVILRNGRTLEPEAICDLKGALGCERLLASTMLATRLEQALEAKAEAEILRAEDRIARLRRVE